jgi:hypothetical protein
LFFPLWILSFCWTFCSTYYFFSAKDYTTTTKGYSNTNLCDYSFKKVLLTLFVTHFLCVPIGHVTIDLFIVYVFL